MDTRFPDLKGHSAQELKWDSFIIQDWVEGFKICNICVLCVCVCALEFENMAWNETSVSVPALLQALKRRL